MTSHRPPSPEPDPPADAPLRLTRTPTANDARRDPKLLEAIARIAPGTRLRSGIDDIIRSHEGALIVIGDPAELAFLYSGGIALDMPFTPQLLFELAKMDGAIIVNESASRLAYANVQLMPDPTIASSETGTRHRTAERVAKQTNALVISISQQRETVTIFLDAQRYKLDRVPDVLAKANQALATLDTYRQRLEQALTRLTALEFQNAVVLEDVLSVVQRAEMTTRMAEEIERDCVELGAEGRLIQLQLEELVTELPTEKRTVIYDYHVSGLKDADDAIARLATYGYQDLLETEFLAQLLGFPRTVNPLDQAVSPRGYRVLSHVPRLSETIVRHVVASFDGLEAIVRATQRELEAVESVGPARAREIREGLRRLQEHNLVERYLQL